MEARNSAPQVQSSTANLRTGIPNVLTVLRGVRFLSSLLALLREWVLLVPQIRCTAGGVVIFDLAMLTDWAIGALSVI